MKRPHIDISLSEEQDRELKKKAKDRGMCKTDYARMKLFSPDFPTVGKDRQKENIITLQEFANKVHISVASARKLCKEKRISYYKVGKVIRINEDEIERFKKREEAIQNGPDMEKYFSTMQAANFLVVTRQTIVKWIKKGDISAQMVKGRYLIPKEELDKFVLQQSSITVKI